MKRLDGLDLTSKQIEGLMACFGAPGQTMLISKQRIAEVNLSHGEIEGLVAKGYLEELSSGDYLMPASSFDIDAFAARMSTKSNEDMIRQKCQGMFGLGISNK